MLAWHSEAYERLSIATIFLEQVIINETMYSINNSEPFVEEFIKIEENILYVLRNILAYLAQSHHLLNPSKIPSREIMSPTYRSMSNMADSAFRDLVILKDVYSSVRYFLCVYRQILSTL